MIRRLALIWAVILVAASPAIAGSPFYLTVERSFANTESPDVRLDFTNQETPLVLRVLRPRDVDGFLDGQLNVSRSYEEPLARINAGHYVLRGLNQVASPLTLLRSALKGGFRRSFKTGDFKEALRPGTRADLATAPAEITQGPPAGFDVVREEYIDLQKGGAAPIGLYGDFDWDFGGRYQVRTITLDPLPDGLYLIQATQAKIEAQALLQVSSLAVQVKQSSTQLVVRVMDREQRPVAGAAAAYRDGRGRWQSLAGRTNAQGELRAEEPDRFDGKLIVRVSADGGRSALVDTDFLPATNSDPSVFIVTDRPIFKPGETFFYKGTIRTREAGVLGLPKTAARNATIHVLRQDGSDTGMSQQVPLSDFASFSGSFDLDPSESPGLYRLAADIDGKPYAGEFRVRDYVKPTFYLEMIDRDPMIRPGETFHLKFRAKRYSGGIPQGAKYEVFVYRKKFEAPAWVAEAGAGLESGHDYFGEVRSATALSEPQRLYSSVEARIAAMGETATPWASAPEISSDGTAAVEIALPKVPEKDAAQDWIYTVMVRAMDHAGAHAVLTENLYMTLADAAVSVRFERVVSDASNQDLRLQLRTTFPDGSPAPGGSGHVELTLEGLDAGTTHIKPLPFRSDAHGFATLSFPRPATGGRLRAVAVLEGRGDKHFARSFTSEPAITVLAGAEGQAIIGNHELQLYAERTVLSPGERTRVLALLPVGWGTQEDGVLWETIAGSQVFATNSVALHGRSRWFEVEARPEYGTGFYETITLPLPGGKYHEETIGFRIIPADKRLNIAIEPAGEIAEPMKPFTIAFEVRDQSGSPAANTELSINVVDRAVYAVQPEFRPSVLDFFYPLPRLNLGTFYSDELQGYGYAAEIQHPNFQLTALKANIQPVKRDMRDTAGWFPHVVTDENGHASVTVDMPANVTEWVVTAIAADRGGRVGEGKGTFRSAADVAFEPIIPRFLREGDVTQGHVELQNHKTDEIKLGLELRATGGAVLEGQSIFQNISIPAKEASLLPAQLSTAAAEGTALIELLPSATEARTGGPTTVEVALRPAAIDQVFAAARHGAALDFALPAEARRGQLRVRVLSGLLGASLSAAAELVSYPFGCTEQLADTTLPNLLLLDLVARAHIDQNELKPLGLTTSVDRAKTNARVGIKKLVTNQKADGGFSLWPAETDSNFAVTAIAARVLHLAAELKVEGASGALMRATNWLADHVSAETIPDSALGLYEIEIVHELDVWTGSQRSLELVEQTLAKPSPSTGELITALRLLKPRGDREWSGEEIERLGSRPRNADVLAGQLKERARDLASHIDLQTVRNDFADVGFCYGEPVLIAAVLGALHDAGALDPDLRSILTRQLLERFENGWWRSTFQTAAVLFNLRDILATEAIAWRMRQGTAPSHRTLRSPATGLSFELTPVPGAFVGSFAVERPQDLAHLEIEGTRENEITSAVIKAAVPFAATRPLANGLSVQRTLLKVTGHTVTPVEPQALERGDVVVSQVVVQRTLREPERVPADATPSDFIVIEDGIPSIAEPIEDDRTYLADAGIQNAGDTYWANVKETLRYPDRTVRVVALKPGAAIAAYQVWRAAFAGRASVPPSRAFDMYDETVAGNGVAVQLVVR